jgi:hypothetical protein
VNVPKENETGRRSGWCWKKNERRFRSSRHSLTSMVSEILSIGEKESVSRRLELKVRARIPGLKETRVDFVCLKHQGADPGM